jgi:hypothetical protein
MIGAKTASKRKAKGSGESGWQLVGLGKRFLSRKVGV